MSIRVEVLGDAFPRRSSVSDIYLTQVVRFDDNGDNVVKHLDVVATWKGLSYRQAVELIFWEQAFQKSLESLIETSLISDFTALEHDADTCTLPESETLSRIHQYVNSFGHKEFSFSLKNLVEFMLEYHDAHGRHCTWFQATGDMYSLVANFLRTKDCFIQHQESYCTLDIYLSASLHAATSTNPYSRLSSPRRSFESDIGVPGQVLLIIADVVSSPHRLSYVTSADRAIRYLFEPPLLDQACRQVPHTVGVCSFGCSPNNFAVTLTRIFPSYVKFETAFRVTVADGLTVVPTEFTTSQFTASRTTNSERLSTSSLAGRRGDTLSDAESYFNPARAPPFNTGVAKSFTSPRRSRHKRFPTDCIDAAMSPMSPLEDCTNRHSWTDPTLSELEKDTRAMHPQLHKTYGGSKVRKYNTLPSRIPLDECYLFHSPRNGKRHHIWTCVCTTCEGVRQQRRESPHRDHLLYFSRYLARSATTFGWEDENSATYPPPPPLSRHRRTTRGRDQRVPSPPRAGTRHPAASPTPPNEGDDDTSDDIQDEVADNSLDEDDDQYGNGIPLASDASNNTNPQEDDHQPEPDAGHEMEHDPSEEPTPYTNLWREDSGYAAGNNSMPVDTAPDSQKGSPVRPRGGAGTDTEAPGVDNVRNSVVMNTLVDVPPFDPYARFKPFDHHLQGRAIATPTISRRHLNALPQSRANDHSLMILMNASIFDPVRDAGGGSHRGGGVPLITSPQWRTPKRRCCPHGPIPFPHPSVPSSNVFDVLASPPPGTLHINDRNRPNSVCNTGDLSTETVVHTTHGSPSTSMKTTVDERTAYASVRSAGLSEKAKGKRPAYEALDDYNNASTQTVTPDGTGTFELEVDWDKYGTLGLMDATKHHSNPEPTSSKHYSLALSYDGSADTTGTDNATEDSPADRDIMPSYPRVSTVPCGPYRTITPSPTPKPRRRQATPLHFDSRTDASSAAAAAAADAEQAQIQANFSEFLAKAHERDGGRVIGAALVDPETKAFEAIFVGSPVSEGTVEVCVSEAETGGVMDVCWGDRGESVWETETESEGEEDGESKGEGEGAGA